MYGAVDSRLLAIWYDFGLDVATALQCSNHDGFPPIVLANLHAKSAGLVHVSRLAADESLIHLDFTTGTAKLASVLPLHRQPDALKHEPRRLLGNPESAVHLPRTDAILAVRNHPHRGKPLV